MVDGERIEAVLETGSGIGFAGDDHSVTYEIVRSR